jgi:8-oxo-dGTP pyrophosphatase MutT (NUDIX family)
MKRLKQDLIEKFKPFNCNHNDELNNNQFSFEKFPHCDLNLNEKSLLKCSWLMLVFHLNNQFYVLLTIRSFKLKSYPGELCFPGGKFDPILDKTFTDTAFREANEEIGLDRKNVTTICKLCPFISPIGHYICPVIGLLTKDQTDDYLDKDEEILELLNSLKPNDEVESIFWLPFSYFLNEERLSQRVNLFDLPIKLDDTLKHLDIISKKYFRFIIHLEDELFEKNGINPLNNILYGINAGILLFVVKTILGDKFNLNQLFRDDYYENFEIYEYLKHLRLKGYLMYRDNLIRKEKKLKAKL